MLECCRHPEWIFVFGSNLSGRHGRGAAYHAKLHHGARNRCGQGIQGTSYGIPTKNARIETLPLGHIRTYVNVFLGYATTHPELTFYVTRIGCGLAGYREAAIAPLFVCAPTNCVLPKGWPQ